MKKIAIIGSPGSGKSTLANGLYYFLKINKHHAEVVPELIKYKVYQDMDFSEEGFDTLNTLEQKNFEMQFSSEKAIQEIDYLICEAPLCNGYFYASFYKKDLELSVLKSIATKYINKYDIILFVKHLVDNEYVEFGRKETKEQSLVFEQHIEKELNKLKCNVEIIDVNNKTDILEIINKILK